MDGYRGQDSDLSSLERPDEIAVGAGKIGTERK